MCFIYGKRMSEWPAKLLMNTRYRMKTKTSKDRQLCGRTNNINILYPTRIGCIGTWCWDISLFFFFFFLDSNCKMCVNACRIYCNSKRKTNEAFCNLLISRRHNERNMPEAIYLSSKSHGIAWVASSKTIHVHYTYRSRKWICARYW